MDAEEPRFLTPDEFAAQSGLSIATVRRYLKARRLPMAQPGGPRCRVVIPTWALESLCDIAHSIKQVVETKATEVAANPMRPSGPQPRWMQRSGRSG
jgi:hypothetical protein